MFESKIPLWEYLAFVPAWGTPILVVIWTTVRLAAAQWRNALVGFLAGTGAWLLATVAYLAVEFMIQPCLENCSGRYRAPWQDLASFVAVAAYTGVAVLIVVRLHKSRWSRADDAARSDVGDGGSR